MTWSYILECRFCIYTLTVVLFISTIFCSLVGIKWHHYLPHNEAPEQLDKTVDDRCLHGSDHTVVMSRLFLHRRLAFRCCFPHRNDSALSVLRRRWRGWELCAGKIVQQASVVGAVTGTSKSERCPSYLQVLLMLRTAHPMKTMVTFVSKYFFIKLHFKIRYLLVNKMLIMYVTYIFWKHVYSLARYPT